jgi:hypothetical protein
MQTTRSFKGPGSFQQPDEHHFLFSSLLDDEKKSKIFFFFLLRLLSLTLDIIPNANCQE